MIFFLSSRFSFSHSPSLRARSLRILFSVTLSLLVVIVIISIMNFLQTSRFDTIRDIRSFDVVVSGDKKDEISSRFPSSTVFLYGEGEALSQKGSFLVRYIDSSYSGGLNMFLGDKEGLLIPFSLYKSNGFEPLELSMLKTGKRVTSLKSDYYTPSGIYYTRLGSDFDSTMLFLPLSSMDENISVKTAIKNVTEEELEIIKKEYEAVDWKEAESSLYASFLIEKALMYAVLSLLFIIIAVSCKSSVALFFSQREKELAELEILGVEKKRINIISFLSFFYILLTGIILSFILGLIVLNLLELYSSNSSRLITMTLSLPLPGFIFFSLSLIIFTLVFVSLENRKRNKVSIYEVIHG